jgi:hypothetical protein
MMDEITATQHAIGMREKGETTTPNVEVVRMMGVRLISGRIPREVRAELQAAVKAGRLGHLKKDRFLPEALFHPNAKGTAIQRREVVARQSIAALGGVYARPNLIPDAGADE